MVICKIHKHSSEESARACAIRRLEKKVRTSMQNYHFAFRSREMRTYPRGRITMRGPFEMVVFSEDGNMQY